MREHDSKSASEFAMPETMVLQSLDMSGFEGTQWEAAYDALTLAINGMQGIENQPRCSGSRGLLNAAGDYLDCLSEFLHLERTRLMENLRLYRPTMDVDKARRACLLMKYEAECGELSMSDMAAYALSLTSEAH